mgnify:CR=1 FL=1
MQSRAYYNFKTRERAIAARRRINPPRGESGINGQNLKQDTGHDRRDSQDKHLTREYKKT